MQQFSESELGHRNLTEFTREDTRWQSPHELVERDGVLLFAGASDFMAMCNGARRVDDATPGADLIAMAQTFFTERGRGFSAFSRTIPDDDDIQAAADAAGLMTWGEGSPQMICRQRLPEHDLPVGVTIDAVDGPDDVARFAHINGEAYTIYGAPAESSSSHFSGRRALVGPNVRAVLARLDGEPVGTTLVYFADGIAGVYWVAVLEEARGRGIAAALMQHITNLGFDLGAANVQLQASTMGDPIYRRLGYEELYRYRMHLAMPPT